MNFKRHDVQEFIEYDLGCLDIENWKSYLPSLLKFTVDETKKSSLENCIESDIFSYLYKSIYSFVQALTNIKSNNYNWSIVQLYYACFYAIRADILLSNHCIIRCSGLYIAEIQLGKKFESFKINKVRGDHQMTIALLKKLKNEYKLTDEILDIELEDIDAYSWLMKHRERSNYQIKNFTDPNIDILFQHVDNYFKTNTLFDLLDFYNRSDYGICFDIDHSALAIPFKKIMQVKEKIKLRYEFNIRENHKHYLYINDKLNSLGVNKANMKELFYDNSSSQKV